MDYQKHYNLLISRSKSENRKKYKKLDINFVYYEKHHIVPKCLGGTNDKTNLVLLTPEEHYLAHQLLVKIYPNNHSLIKAANMMCTSSAEKEQIRNNKRFGWLRRKLSQVFSIEKSGKESPLKGRPSPLRGKPGATKGYASPNKGKTFGPNGQKGTKKGPSPFKGLPSGRKGIPSEKKGIPSGKKGSIRGPNKEPMTRISCPHCNKEGGISQMKRYHLDNCKLLETLT